MKPSSPVPDPPPSPSPTSGPLLTASGQSTSPRQGPVAGHNAPSKPRATGNLGIKLAAGVVALCAGVWLMGSWMQHNTQPPLVGPFPGDAQNQVASPALSIPQTASATLPIPSPALQPSSALPSAPSSTNGGAPSASGVTPASGGSIMVHVSGQVVHPGVYTLDSNARVADAIAQAGGALPAGDPDALNLAAHLTDGTKLEVPARQSSGLGTALAGRGSNSLPASAPVKLPTSAPDPNSLRAVMGGAALDLNTATQADLEALPGVGPIMATHIIEYRVTVGRFNSVDDLDNVKGIGPKKLAELRPFLMVR